MRVLGFGIMYVLRFVVDWNTTVAVWVYTAMSTFEQGTHIGILHLPDETATTVI